MCQRAVNHAEFIPHTQKTTQEKQDYQGLKGHI